MTTGFPSTRDLPTLLTDDDLAWDAPSGGSGFWTGLDSSGTRWVVKFRGGLYAVRERAFSLIAQALGISCQSSAYLKMPSHVRAWPIPPRQCDSKDVHQLAIWFLEEHRCEPNCPSCPVVELQEELRGQGDAYDTLRSSRIEHAVDLARGEMLGYLCGMYEPPDPLFTADHTFVQIDNESMFSPNSGADLWECRWIAGAHGLNGAGLAAATQLCEQMLDLAPELFDEATLLPEGYQPDRAFSVHREVQLIRPRAIEFLKRANWFRGV